MSVSLYGSGQTVIQVVQATSTATFSTNSSTPVASGVIATITPQSTTSKILVIASGGSTNNSGSTNGAAMIYRQIAGGGYSNWTSSIATSFNYVSSGEGWGLSWQYLDSPATTSAINYQIYAACGTGSFALNNPPYNPSGTTGMLQITLLEISGS
jgi:hypothetical protein